MTLPADATHPAPRKVVFQGASNITANYWTKTGQPRKVRAHVIPADPKTPAQMQRRAHMRAGVLLWQAMPPSEKEAWRAEGKTRQITGFNAFTSWHLKRFIVDPFATWDAGPVTWDSGAATWDAGAANWQPDKQAIWDGSAATWD